MRSFLASLRFELELHAGWGLELEVWPVVERGFQIFVVFRLVLALLSRIPLWPRVRTSV